jgi:hypothetical protein
LMLILTSCLPTLSLRRGEAMRRPPRASPQNRLLANDVVDDALAERPIEGLPEVANGTGGRAQKVTPVLWGSGRPLPCQ